jgi:AcrR family transcriptional regulator
MRRAEKRTHLLDVATALFNRFGYRAIGIDQVIAESGVAKTTLYRHFESKEDLIVAVLERLDEGFRSNMRQFVENKRKKPSDQLLATFDFLRDWFKDAAFYGCPFINAAGEYSERQSAVFHTAVLHKRLMVAYFEELARAAGLHNPKRVAEEINLLHEGAIAVAHIKAGRRATHRRGPRLALCVNFGA